MGSVREAMDGDGDRDIVRPVTRYEMYPLISQASKQVRKDGSLLRNYVKLRFIIIKVGGVHGCDSDIIKSFKGANSCVLRTMQPQTVSQ